MMAFCLSLVIMKQFNPQRSEMIGLRKIRNTLDYELSPLCEWVRIRTWHCFDLVCSIPENSISQRCSITGR